MVTYWELDGYDVIPADGPADPILIDTATIGDTTVSTVVSQVMISQIARGKKWVAPNR